MPVQSGLWVEEIHAVSSRDSHWHEVGCGRDSNQFVQNSVQHG